MFTLTTSSTYSPQHFPQCKFTLQTHLQPRWKMLTYPNRQKFEQIRAQWETAQSPGDQKMVGRKEKQIVNQSVHSERNGGGSKFRRKLSHGLSFISNPLSQRKTTPGRQTLQDQPFGLSSNTIHSATTASLPPSNNPLSPERDSYPLDRTNGPSVRHTPSTNNDDTAQIVDPDATPKPLPHSRTMSFIPRPTRSNSELSMAEPDSSEAKSCITNLAVDSQVGTAPTKIPSPSPPRNGFRRASPRQYKHFHTIQQEKHIAAGAAFAAASAQSPSKASIRSYTTPNLVKGTAVSQPHFMMPRKPATQHRLSSSSGVRSFMKENTPTGRRDSQQLPQNQQKDLRRTSFIPKGSPPNRRSLGPSSALAQSKQPIRTTPSTSMKRLSMHSSIQTPLTVKRLPTNGHGSVNTADSVRKLNGSSIAQPRLMGPVNPPTPIPADPSSLRPTLPRASTDKDIRRKTFGTPSMLASGRASSRSLVGTSNEVRLPRSSTFYHIPKFHELPPPVPPIPEMYKSAPYSETAYNASHPSDGGSQSRPLSVVSAFKSSLPRPWGFKPGTYSAISNSSSPCKTVAEDYDSEKSSLEEPSDEEAALLSLMALPKITSCFPKHPRLFSIIQGSGTYANASTLQQVKDYMSPLWWAGRFQARFDQWRNEAMRTELDPKYKPEGLLAQCNLNQDKVAACYIFMQLRDLCRTDQAADSLWVYHWFTI